MRNLGRTHTLNNLKQRPRNKSSEAQCFYPLIWKWRSEITTPCTTQVLRSTKSKFRNLWEPTRTSRRASFFLWEFWRSWGYIMWGCLKAKYRSIFFKSKLNYYRKWTLFGGGKLWWFWFPLSTASNFQGTKLVRGRERCNDVTLSTCLYNHA